MDFIEIIGSIIVGIILIIIGFYLKNLLTKKYKINSFKKKFENIAGKNAHILYKSSMVGFDLYKIETINNSSFILKNSYETIYIPIENILSENIIIPSPNYFSIYENIDENRMKRSAQINTEALTEALVQKAIPEMMKYIEESIQDEKSDISVKMALSIEKIIKEEGYEKKKLKN